MSTFPLPNGTGKIPAIGLGTYLSKDREGERAIEHAIRVGYRHLDLAFAYGNQEEVGVALKKVIPSVVKREDLFIVTKLWNSSHHPEAVEAELDLSLKQLDQEYIDLYLMHWPVAFPKLKDQEGPSIKGEIDFSVAAADTWVAMNKLLKTGKVKNVGVSNFTVEHLKQLISVTGIKPAVNQVELHPYLPQDDLLEYSNKEGIHLTGYFPLGGLATVTGSDLLTNPVVKEIAAKHEGATTASVLINWGVARGYSVIPKSATPERITSNLVELKLSAEDVKKISSLEKDTPKRFVLPAKAFGWKVDIFGTPDEEGLPKVLIANEKK